MSSAHDLTSGSSGPAVPDWDLVLRPRRSARISVVVAVLLVAIFIGVGVSLPEEISGVSVNASDQWGMVGVGLLLACLALAFTRPRVRVGWRGVETRAFFGSPRLVEWPVIRGVDFVPKTRFARLVLPADEVIVLYAIQRGDRELSVEAMRRLRAEHARWGAG